MMNTAKQRFNRLQLWSKSYDLVSFGLGLGLLFAFVASLWFFAGWRHDLFVTRCTSLYDTSFIPSACSFTDDLDAWIAAFVEGLPFAGGLVLVLLGLGYVLFRKRLGLTSYWDRGDAFVCLVYWALGVTFVPLAMFGVGSLIFHS
jgi:hypothetical protein